MFYSKRMDKMKHLHVPSMTLCYLARYLGWYVALPKNHVQHSIQTVKMLQKLEKTLRTPPHRKDPIQNIPTHKEQE